MRGRSPTDAETADGAVVEHDAELLDAVIATDAGSAEDGPGPQDVQVTEGDLSDVATLDAAPHDAAPIDAPPSDPRVCERSPTIADSVTIQGPFFGATAQVPSCTPSGGVRFAVFARVTLRARSTLTVLSGPPFSVSLFEDCRAAVCLTGTDSFGTARFVNERSTPRELVLALQSATASNPVPAFLRVDIAPLAPEARCETAPTVRRDAPLRVQIAPTSSTLPRCDNGVGVPVGFARVETPPGARVTATVSGAGLRMLSRCDEAACLPGEARSTIAWTNDATTTASRLIAVYAGPSGGLHDLAVRFDTPRPEDRCETATTISDGATLEGIDLARGGDDRDLCGQRAAPHWLRAPVPPGHRVELTTTATERTSPEISLLRSCDATACTPPTIDLRGEGSRVVVLDNVTSATSPVFAGLHGIRGIATLRARIYPIPDEARCATAPSIDAGLRTDEPLREAGFGAFAACADPFAARLYRVSVPPLHRLEVQATPRGPGALDVTILDGCARGTCLPTQLTADAPTGGVSRHWTNSASASREVVVAVRDPARSVSPPSFDLAVTLRPPVSNATCAGAQPLEPGVEVPVVISDGRELASNCVGQSSAALFYLVNVPPGQRLRVEASPSDPGNAETRILGACGDATCLGGFSTVFSPPGAIWTHTGTTSRAVIVAVSRERPDGSPLRLRASLETPANNGRCADARPVVAGESVRDARQDDARERVSACRGIGTPALFFSVEVPPGRVLAVRPQAGTNNAPYVMFLDGCGGPCLAESSSNFGWRNNGATRTVIVAVTSASSWRAIASYDLSFELL